MANASATAPSAHRLFHKLGDLGLFAGSQLAERVLNRPHGGVSVFPSALAASALSSRTRSRAAAFSSALNPLDAVSVALVRLARFCVVLVAVLVGAILCAPVRELTRTILSLLPQWLATQRFAVASSAEW